MRYFLLSLAVGAALLGSIPVGADADGRAADAVNLGKYRWQSRVLLVFAGNDTDTAYQRQQRLMDGNGEGIAERDMVVGAFTDKTGGVLGTTALSPKAVMKLRREHGLAPGEFAVLLLGKDGGVKLRRDEPVKANTLFALIDGMPMRQGEIRSTKYQVTDKNIYSSYNTRYLIMGRHPTRRGVYAGWRAGSRGRPRRLPA